MSKTTRITIEAIDTKVIKAKKDGKEYKIIQLKDSLNNVYEGFSDENTEKLKVGDSVEISVTDSKFGKKFRLPRKRKNLEDCLDIGEHVLSFVPVLNKDNEHVMGENSYGNWYMYSTIIDGEEVSTICNDKNKFMFDSGEVKVTVKQKELKGEPAWKIEEGADGTPNPVPVKIAFFDEVG